MTGRLRGGIESGRVLVVEGVQQPDVGVYQCRVQGGGQETAMAAATLQLGGGRGAVYIAVTAV